MHVCTDALGVRALSRSTERACAQDDRDIFIGRALNPLSWYYKAWLVLVKTLALYYFIAVPIRLCFRPWPTYTDSRGLALDLSADCLAFLHGLVVSKTAYRTKAGRLATLS